MLKQPQYITMADYEKAVQEAIGPDKEGYERKKNRLYQRWGEEQLFATRVSELMLQVVGNKFSHYPIDYALVSDNLEFFRSKYTNLYGQKPELALQIACLCGSKKIALFLLGILETELTNPKMHYLLEYIMTSDIEWAQEVAQDMIKAGQQGMPKGISGFPTMDEYLKVQDLFIRAEEEAGKNQASSSSSSDLEKKKITDTSTDTSEFDHVFKEAIKRINATYRKE